MSSFNRGLSGLRGEDSNVKKLQTTNNGRQVMAKAQMALQPDELIIIIIIIMLFLILRSFSTESDWNSPISQYRTDSHQS